MTGADALNSYDAPFSTENPAMMSCANAQTHILSALDAPEFELALQRNVEVLNKINLTSVVSAMQLMTSDWGLNGIELAKAQFLLSELYYACSQQQETLAALCAHNGSLQANAFANRQAASASGMTLNQETLPLIINAVEVFTYFITTLIPFILLISGGYMIKILSSWLMLLAWANLLPITSVISRLYVEHYTGFAEQCTALGGQCTFLGTIGSIDTSYTTVETALGMAGTLSAIIPTLTFFLLSGSAYAAMGAFGGLAQRNGAGAAGGGSGSDFSGAAGSGSGSSGSGGGSGGASGGGSSSQGNSVKVGHSGAGSTAMMAMSSNSGGSSISSFGGAGVSSPSFSSGGSSFNSGMSSGFGGGVSSSSGVGMGSTSSSSGSAVASGGSGITMTQATGNSVLGAVSSGSQAQMGASVNSSTGASSQPNVTASQESNRSDQIAAGAGRTVSAQQMEQLSQQQRLNLASHFTNTDEQAEELAGNTQMLAALTNTLNDQMHQLNGQSVAGELPYTEQAALKNDAMERSQSEPTRKVASGVVFDGREIAASDKILESASGSGFMFTAGNMINEAAQFIPSEQGRAQFKEDFNDLIRENPEHWQQLSDSQKHSAAERYIDTQASQYGESVAQQFAQRQSELGEQFTNRVSDLSHNMDINSAQRQAASEMLMNKLAEQGSVLSQNGSAASGSALQDYADLAGVYQSAMGEGQEKYQPLIDEVQAQARDTFAAEEMQAEQMPANLNAAQASLAPRDDGIYDRQGNFVSATELYASTAPIDDFMKYGTEGQPQSEEQDYFAAQEASRMARQQGVIDSYFQTHQDAYDQTIDAMNAGINAGDAVRREHDALAQFHAARYENGNDVAHVQFNALDSAHADVLQGYDWESAIQFQNAAWKEGREGSKELADSSLFANEEPAKYWQDLSVQLAKFGDINKAYDKEIAEADSWLDVLGISAQRNAHNAWQAYNTLLQASTVPMLEGLGLMDTGQRNAIEFELGAGGGKQASIGAAYSFGINNQGQIAFNRAEFENRSQDYAVSYLPEKPGANINFSLTKGYDMEIKGLTQGRMVAHGVKASLPAKSGWLPNEIAIYEGYTTTSESGPMAPQGRVRGLELAWSRDINVGLSSPVNGFSAVQYVPEHETYNFEATPFTKALYGSVNGLFKAFEAISPFDETITTAKDTQAATVSSQSVASVERRNSVSASTRNGEDGTHWDPYHHDADPAAIKKAHSGKLEQEAVNRHRAGLRTKIDNEGLSAPDERYAQDKVRLSERDIADEKSRLLSVNGGNIHFDSRLSEVEKQSGLTALAISSLGLKNDLALAEDVYQNARSVYDGYVQAKDYQQLGSAQSLMLDADNDLSEIRTQLNTLEKGNIQFHSDHYTGKDGTKDYNTFATMDDNTGTMNIYTPFYASGLEGQVNTIVHEAVHGTDWNTRIHRVESADTNPYDGEKHTPAVKYGNQVTERVARANAQSFINKYSWDLGEGK